jgi:hypothetical protein
MTDALMTLEMVAGTLPDPVEFRRRAMQAARDGYAAAVDGQDVRTPEDTASVQLSLARTRELAQQYAATFTAVDKELARFQRDQLELLPGGPSAFKVADSDGDLIVQLDTSNTYTFDEGQLLFAVAADTARDAVLDELIHLVEDSASYDAMRTALGERLAVLLVGMVETVAALGSLKMQVTKVKAFADQLQRNGDTVLAGVVRDTIMQEKNTKPGAKFTRKEPKS